MLALAAPLGCASAEREMLPVERVVTYSETANYEGKAAWYGQTQPDENPYAAKCRKYREDIEAYRGAYLASLGVGVVGVVVGLLSDDETVQEVAGAAAATSLVSQAGAATAINNTANEAREWGCDLP
jgi:hypothetical protein